MKKIEKWLNENRIYYNVKNYGNPYYFNDGFSVSGISVTFHFDDIENAWEDRKKLEKYMVRKKAYKCICERFGDGYSYRIMTVIDAIRLDEHEKKIQEAVGKFWEEEHTRRTKETA